MRFLGRDRLVSASTDSTLRSWGLDGLDSAQAVYDGHLNDKNFVGLSAEGDFVACGSETNEVRHAVLCTHRACLRHRKATCHAVVGRPRQPTTSLSRLSSASGRAKSPRASRLRAPG